MPEQLIDRSSAALELEPRFSAELATARVSVHATVYPDSRV
jgi:hypothetical protein